MLLLYAGLSTPSGGAGAGGGASPETGLALEEGGTRTLPPLVRSISRALLLVGWLGSVITLVALAALVVYLLRRPAGGTDAARAVPERGPADAEKREVDPSAVRALYRSFLEVMRARGLERHPSDAPGDFARRAAERFPELAGAVNAITRAYLPVRYGGRPDLETFDQARAALAHIQETA
nr:DUF4129 domain-containing protein [Deinobacterium chartae]